MLCMVRWYIVTHNKLMKEFQLLLMMSFFGTNVFTMKDGNFEVAHVQSGRVIWVHEPTCKMML